MEFIYGSDFPCHLKVNGAINLRWWKCKKDLTITANSLSKIDQRDDSARRDRADGKISPAPRANQISKEFVELSPLTILGKN